MSYLMFAWSRPWNTLYLGLVLFLTLALGGCSTTRRIDSQVLTAQVPLVAGTPLVGARYRFERLPSQIQNPAAGLAEQYAQGALSQVGLIRDDAGAQLSIQVAASASALNLDPWGRPLWGWGVGMGSYGYRGHGFGMSGSMGWGMRQPAPMQYHYDVSIVMRDLRSAQVVYETHALHNGPWGDADALLPVLMQAALNDFPNPSTASRQVNIDIPR